MKYYQCLAIGINRYHFLSPLRDADQDAKKLYEFFEQEAGIPQEHLLLLSDTSPWLANKSTYPNQDNLLFWLGSNFPSQYVPAVSAPLWLFFRGYGFTYQGQDYLIPIDGNPQDFPHTALSIVSILEAIQEKTQQPLLLILDLTPVVVGMPVGQHTVILGKQKGIGVILYPRRSDTLEPRIFTTALLEALNYYRYQLTLAQLSSYLCDRLSDLSSEDGQALPTPIIISPNLSFSSQLLIPSPFPETVMKTSPAWVVNEASTEESEISEPVATATLSLPTIIPVSEDVTATPDFETQEEPLLNPVLNREIKTPKPKESDQNLVNSPWLIFFRKIKYFKWFWLGGISGLVLAFLIIQFVRLNLFPSTPSSESFNSTAGDSSFPSPLDKERQLLNQARQYLKDNQASGFSRAINQAQQIPVQSPLYREAQADIQRWSQIIWDIAQARANQDNYHDAIAAALLVPKTQEQLYQIAQQGIKQWQIAAQKQQVNLALIDGAKALIQANQASSYNRSITILRQISPQEPSYEQAQTLIEQWSRQIYLIANTRAAQGNFQAAIATAQLVPKNTSSYEMAQTAIFKWQKQ